MSSPLAPLHLLFMVLHGPVLMTLPSRLAAPGLMCKICNKGLAIEWDPPPFRPPPGFPLDLELCKITLPLACLQSRAVGRKSPSLASWAYWLDWLETEAC